MSITDVERARRAARVALLREIAFVMAMDPDQYDMRLEKGRFRGRYPREVLQRWVEGQIDETEVIAELEQWATDLTTTKSRKESNNGNQ